MTASLLTFTLTVFTGFFAIMNPIANTPVFLALVEGRDKGSKKRIAKTACITAFIIVVSFTVLGKYIFEVFGITIPAFKITGGLLVFYVGFEMLQSKSSQIQQQENLDKDDGIAISPLAIPVMAGPGTIVTAMNFMHDSSFLHLGIVIIIFAIMVFLTYVAFTAGDAIIEKIGQNLIKVIGKIMGLIISIIGTDMVIAGIKLAFKI